MSGLIDALRAEHVRLFDILKGVLDDRVSNAVGHKRLMEARDLILAHLQKEDAELYPRLVKASEKDAGLKKVLDEHLAEILEVTRVVRGFFSDHPEHCTDMKCIRDFGTLYMMFKGRKDLEEKVLFQAYDVFGEER